MIEFKTFNKLQLKEFIYSEDFANLPFKPISVHRAESQINNPASTVLDTLLILVFSNNQLAGYIGILPQNINHNGQVIHFGWLSTLLISPDLRGQKIGQQLLTKACDEYQGKIVITEFTPVAEALYNKSNYFFKLPALEGEAFHYLLNLSNILPKKEAKWKKYTPIFKFTDSVFNLVMTPVAKFFSSKETFYSIDSKLDQNAEEFIRKNSNDNNFDWNYEDIDWILKNPWIKNSNIKSDSNYEFSSYENQFEYKILKIVKDETLVQILIISIKNGVIKVLDSFGSTDLGAKALHHFAQQNTISCIISYDSKINSYLRTKFTLFKKKRKRNFMMHKDLHKILGNDFQFNISAGGSDSVFT